MECETAIGGSDADEREQNQRCNEEFIANKNVEQNGNMENIPEQGSSEEGTSDTNAELKNEKKLDKDDECLTTIGGSDSEEREQSQRCDEQSVESKNPEKNGNKEEISEQGSSKEHISDANAEPKAGSSGSFSDDEQPGCSR